MMSSFQRAGVFLAGAATMAAVAVACGSSDPVHGTAPIGGSGGATASASASSSGGAGGSGQASSASQSSGNASSGASSSSSGGGFPATVCSMKATWSVGTSLPLSTAADDLLAGATPDELTIAWVTGTDGAAVVHYADRTDPQGAFSAAATLPASSKGTALDRVALSADGLRIGIVRGDHQGFLEYTRTQRGNAFSEQGEGTFVNLNLQASSFTAGMGFSDPVLSPGDELFMYSIYGGSAVTIQSAARIFPGDPWGAGNTAGGAALEAQGTKRRRPTGLSADRLTLFFWDEGASLEREAFRATWLEDFTVFVDLGQHAGATPNAACDALYYDAAGTNGLDLFRATKN